MSSTMLDMFGPTLKSKSGTVDTSEALANKDVVALYFSAHWCPPCRGFTPTLCKKYEALLEAGKSLEMVFVSSDSDSSSFDSYHATMPFLALPYSDRSRKATLSTKFGVSGIPSLVFIDGKTGKLITDEGRGSVSSANFIENFPYHPKPCNDLGESMGGIQDNASLVVIMDQAEDSVKTALAAIVNDIAVAEFKKDESAKRVGRFFTGKGGGPLSQIRRGVGLPSAPPAKHPHELKLTEGGGWGCDGCGQSGQGKQRWKCSAGCNFDYCGECNAIAGNAPDPSLISAKMIILNLSDQGAFYSPAEGSEDVTEANIQAFLTAFTAGSLIRKQFGG